MRVLTPTGITPADIVIFGEHIDSVEEYQSTGTATDFGTRLIVPGFIDLHSDAIEKEIEPRPGADFPVKNAVVELDKKLTMCGITTMFHAIGFNDASVTGIRALNRAADIIREIGTANRAHLGVDNLVHARFEITSFQAADPIQQLIDEDWVHLLSIMDHTPGQGQFKTVEKWKQFHVPVYDLSDEQAQQIISQKTADQPKALAAMRKLLEFGKKHDLILLSHDDDTPAKVDLVKEMGVTVSEFPLDKAVAGYAKEQGLATGMGAPNVVRGKSQSGNISARDMVDDGICDFLCSDYHPTSMLQSVYTMNETMGIPLEDGFKMISETPARLADLEDRGSIESAKLADLLVIEDFHVPKIVLTLKEGEAVYNSLGCLCQ